MRVVSPSVNVSRQRASVWKNRSIKATVPPVPPSSSKLKYVSVYNKQEREEDMKAIKEMERNEKKE